MGTHIGTLISLFVDKTTVSISPKGDLLDRLDGQQIDVAGAYVDIEAAHIIHNDAKSYGDLIAEYCGRKQIALPKNDADESFVLENRGDVTSTQIENFIETLDYADAERLHIHARNAVVDMGYSIVERKSEMTIPEAI